VATRGAHAHHALPAHHQRAGEHTAVGQLFGHRLGLGLAAERGLVGGELVRLQQQAVGWHAVALGEQQHVVTHHLAP
jgi:hypothetical protein